MKFHARFGHYHETRIPLSGRVLCYVPFLAHLLLAGDSAELHRLDLCEGKFLEPVCTELESVNACGTHYVDLVMYLNVPLDLSLAHGLVCCAGSDGSLQCIDVRQKTCVGSLNVAQVLQKVLTQIH